MTIEKRINLNADLEYLLIHKENNLIYCGLSNQKLFILEALTLEKIAELDTINSIIKMLKIPQISTIQTRLDSFYHLYDFEKIAAFKSLKIKPYHNFK